MAPFLDSSISMLKQLTAVSFSPALPRLPLDHSRASVNLTVLQGLAELTQLELKNTHISAASQLEALTQLRMLKLDSCYVNCADSNPGKSAAHILHVSWKQQSLGDVEWDSTEQLPAMDALLVEQGLHPSLLSAVCAFSTSQACTPVCEMQLISTASTCRDLQDLDAAAELICVSQSGLQMASRGVHGDASAASQDCACRSECCAYRSY